MSLEKRYENLYTVRSPAAGIFCRVYAPGEEPYAEVGARVGTGQTLCVISAMDLAWQHPVISSYVPDDLEIEVLHEVAAKVPGKVAEIMVGEGGDVGYDQPLFRVRAGCR